MDTWWPWPFVMQYVIPYAVFDADLEFIPQIPCGVLCSKLRLFLSSISFLLPCKIAYSCMVLRLCLVAALVPSNISLALEGTRRQNITYQKKKGFTI
ncbi:hypothetical protein Y032_0002g876 [Ancylostoma ceylanicum]|uniref:Uncharacterized protein n=1 Tax=Ancylostoma ceylanicum TaxID=53326 RepID=A0A016W1Z5_9BILA|nr:hypothetical protein Y032_0002g876 [Ancylostoma ceylanicum]